MFKINVFKIKYSFIYVHLYPWIFTPLDLSFVRPVWLVINQPHCVKCAFWTKNNTNVWFRHYVYGFTCRFDGIISNLSWIRGLLKYLITNIYSVHKHYIYNIYSRVCSFLRIDHTWIQWVPWEVGVMYKFLIPITHCLLKYINIKLLT